MGSSEARFWELINRKYAPSTQDFSHDPSYFREHRVRPPFRESVILPTSEPRVLGSIIDALSVQHRARLPSTHALRRAHTPARLSRSYPPPGERKRRHGRPGGRPDGQDAGLLRRFGPIPQDTRGGLRRTHGNPRGDRRRGGCGVRPGHQGRRAQGCQEGGRRLRHRRGHQRRGGHPQGPQENRRQAQGRHRQAQGRGSQAEGQRRPGTRQEGEARERQGQEGNRPRPGRHHRGGLRRVVLPSRRRGGTHRILRHLRLLHPPAVGVLHVGADQGLLR